MARRDTPPSRKTHITRIYGRNRDGERIDNMYADFERTDSMQAIDHDGSWQGLAKKFRWRDDPDDGDFAPDGNPNRKFVTLKIVDPSTIDPNNLSTIQNPDEWIPVPVTTQIKHVTNYHGQYQGVVEKFFDPKVSLADYRRVKVRRICHRATTVDNIAEKILREEPERTQMVFSSSDYGWDGEADQSEYVEVEVPIVIKEMMINASSSHLHLPNKFQYPQGRVIKLRNQYLIDESFEPKYREVGEHELNPPYRLDPHQYLINISFGGIAVQFYDGAGGREQR